MIRLPVRILSDLHLGHKASRISSAECMRPLLSGAGTVIFNGDTWEELAEPWRERSAEMLENLKKIIAEEGCDAIFLRGNHDPGWEGPAYVELADRRIVITHGDAILPSASPWKHEILESPETVDRIWAQFPKASHDLEERVAVAREIAIQMPSQHYSDGRSLLSRVLQAAFPPKRALAMLHAWSKQGEMAVRFGETYFPEAKFLILGHFHRTAIHHKRGIRVINTGSFVVPSQASWVSWDGAFLSTGAVAKSRYGYAMAPKSGTWQMD